MDSPPAATLEQREIARAILQTILELGEPAMRGPTAFAGRSVSWLVGEASLSESTVVQAQWESLEIFRFKAINIWRRAMAYEIVKRMDDLDRDTKNAVIKLLWTALPNPSVIAELMSFAPGERPVAIPDTTPAPKVESEAAKRARMMAAYQFGDLQRVEDSGKVEPPKVR